MLKFKDGRNFLVCRDRDKGQGIWWSFVYQVAFGEGGDAYTTPIFGIEDSTLTCNEEVKNSTINAMSFPDLNRDGFPDISITAALGTVRLTEVERQQCNSRHYAFSRFAKQYHVDFLFDGRRFVVAPWSRTSFGLFLEPTMPSR